MACDLETDLRIKLKAKQFVIDTLLPLNSFHVCIGAGYLKVEHM